VAGEFVVSGGDAAPSLEPVDAAFDVAASVGVRVEGWWPSAAPVTAPPTSGLLVCAFGDRGGARTSTGIHTLTFISRAELGERLYQHAHRSRLTTALLVCGPACAARALGGRARR
jgi:hypothetical protein